VTDNHLGDWGTQFGMIIYGYKQFRDEEAYRRSPIQELGRLYQLVRRLIDYHEAVSVLPEAQDRLAEYQAALEKADADQHQRESKSDRKKKKERQLLQNRIHDQRAVVDSLSRKIDGVHGDPELKALAESHPDIAQRVLDETAMLHAGDAENQRLWNEFLPHGLEDIQSIYDRLGVQFDFALGESHYHGQLADLVSDLKQKELARESEGAICVFLDGFDAPMLIQKKDGAFLYATTDLATIKHRVEQWKADVILYVVDHRQHEHFEKLFHAASQWGYDDTTFTHVSFGTVLGEDGKPFKTRSGDTVGLAGLLDEAEQRARRIAAEQNPDLSGAELDRIANVIGIGGLKYVDLSQNRSSDYKFSYDKMLALKGNTATYLQYSYARVQGILRKGGIDVQRLRSEPVEFVFEDDVERKLALSLTRFGEAIDEVLIDYKPNLLTSYLFELTQVFFQFYDRCPVLKTEQELLRKSRLQLCDLTACTIRTGLSLLGIEVVEKM
jgi:arginyl-tRNA synthetase